MGDEHKRIYTYNLPIIHYLLAQCEDHIKVIISLKCSRYLGVYVSRSRIQIPLLQLT